MTVQDVVEFCRHFCVRAGLPERSITFSPPWRPKDRNKERIPQEDRGGIYLFSEPVTPEPSSAPENRGEVWYVGTSSRPGGRIWQHLGPVYDPAGQLLDPPFKGHHWALLQSQRITENVKSVIATGDVVVYVVSIDPPGQDPGWPAVLEKWLLVESYFREGQIPCLNLSM